MTETDQQHIQSKPFILLTNDDFETYDLLTEFYNGHISELELKGSGWYLLSIDFLDVKLLEYEPMVGGCLDNKLPKKLSDNKSIIQLEVNDKKCFLWSVAYLTQSDPSKTNKYRITKKLKDHLDNFNIDDINTPTSVRDIQRFERQNPDFLIYVYGYEDKKFYIHYKHANFHELQKSRKILNLLYIKNSDIGHYYPIINVDTFHNTIFNASKHKLFVCQTCLSYFREEKLLDEHYIYCQHEFSSQLNYAKPETTTKFKKFHAMQKHPFVCYLDTESSLEPMSEKHQNTEFTQIHKPCAYGLLFIDNTKNSSEASEYTQFTNSDEFVQKLTEYALHISEINEPIEKLSDAQKMKIKRTNACDFCNIQFSDKNYKCIDHDHFSDKFRNVLCYTF